MKSQPHRIPFRVLLLLLLLRHVFYPTNPKHPQIPKIMKIPKIPTIPKSKNLKNPPNSKHGRPDIKRARRTGLKKMTKGPKKPPARSQAPRLLVVDYNHGLITFAVFKDTITT